MLSFVARKGGKCRSLIMEMKVLGSIFNSNGWCKVPNENFLRWYIRPQYYRLFYKKLSCSFNDKTKINIENVR